MGMSAGCGNGAPLARPIYMVRNSTTYHNRFFVWARELRVARIVRPIPKLLFVFLVTLVLVGFIDGIFRLASLVFNLI